MSFILRFFVIERNFLGHKLEHAYIHTKKGKKNNLFHVLTKVFPLIFVFNFILYAKIQSIRVDGGQKILL